MSTTRIMFHGTRLQVREIVGRVALALSGRGEDKHNSAVGFSTAIGLAALSDIKKNFVMCADGGVGELGISWPPLSKEYLAYGRRFGPGEKSKLAKAAGLNPRLNKFAPGSRLKTFVEGHYISETRIAHKGLLSADQLERWRKIYGQQLARFAVSLPLGAAKARAAQVAWATLKREGAKTMLDVYGNRKVQILRDTGILLNSLSPGTMSDTQIFEATAGRVIVGTNVPYAAVHNYGHPKKPKMPRRQFLPDTDEQVPEVWYQRWSDVAAEAGMKAVEIALRAAA